MLAGSFIKYNTIRHPVPIYLPWVLELSPLSPFEITYSPKPADLAKVGGGGVFVLDLCISAVDSTPGQMISLTVH